MAEADLDILVRAKNALQAARDIGKVDSAVGKLGRTAAQGAKTTATNLAKVGVVAGAGIAFAAHQGIESLALLEDAETSVTGAIKRMGLSGKVTATQVATWANEIEANVQAAFDDKDITAATATLIRFGKVAPQNIKPAMQIMTDLAVKTGSVDSAATLLGKALADPTKAAGKLARSGVILTKEQQKQIAAFVKAGKVGKAQEVILNSLAKTTKGAAAASAGPYRDSLNILADVTEDAERALGEGFLPVIMEVRDLLQGELAKPSTLANIREFGKTLAGGLKSLINIAKNLPWGAIGDALKTAGAGAKAVLDAFVGMPSWVQTAVLTGWGLNKLSGGALSDIAGSLASGLVKGVLGITAAQVNINAATVTGGGMPGVPSTPGGMGSISKLASISIVATAAYLSVDSIQDFANKNNDLASKGLTKGEIEAQKYYTSDEAAQQQALKHLGHIPSKADFESGNRKLATGQREGMETVTRATDRSTAVAEGIKSSIDTKKWSTTVNVKVPITLSVRNVASKTAVKLINGTPVSGSFGNQ